MARPPDFRDRLKSPLMMLIFWPGFLLGFLNSLSFGLFEVDLLGMLAPISPVLSRACYGLVLLAGLVWLFWGLYWAFLLFSKKEAGGAAQLTQGFVLFAVLLFLAFANCINWGLIGLFGIDVLGAAFAFLPILARVAFLFMALGPGIFVLYILISER